MATPDRSLLTGIPEGFFAPYSEEELAQRRGNIPALPQKTMVPRTRKENSIEVAIQGFMDKARGFANEGLDAGVKPNSGNMGFWDTWKNGIRGMQEYAAENDQNFGAGNFQQALPLPSNGRLPSHPNSTWKPELVLPPVTREPFPTIHPDSMKQMIDYTAGNTPEQKMSELEQYVPKYDPRYSQEVNGAYDRQRGDIDSRITPALSKFNELMDAWGSKSYGKSFGGLMANSNALGAIQSMAPEALKASQAHAQMIAGLPLVSGITTASGHGGQAQRAGQERMFAERAPSSQALASAHNAQSATQMKALENAPNKTEIAEHKVWQDAYDANLKANGGDPEKAALSAGVAMEAFRQDRAGNERYEVRPAIDEIKKGFLTSAVPGKAAEYGYRPRGTQGQALPNMPVGKSGKYTVYQ